MIGRTLDFADVGAAVERDFPRATDREISRAIDIALKRMWTKSQRLRAEADHERMGQTRSS
jgi:hypothetical protein